jgi:hypothetical protein
MWLYKDIEVASIEDMPRDVIGFIYKVTHLPTNKSYIGKKVLQHTLKKKLTKKELAELTGPGKKPTFKRVSKESDWKTYYGSSKPLLAVLKEEGADNFIREIIKYVYTKKQLTYFETKYLFLYGVLEYPDQYFNDNVLGKFYTKDLTSLEIDD